MVLLVPLFFLPISPWQSGADNYGKYFLLGIASLVLLWLFIYKNFLATEQIKTNLLVYLFLILLAELFLASLFGVNFFVSLWGELHSPQFPWLAGLFLVLIFFLLFNIVKTKKIAITIIKCILWSGAIFVLVSFIILLFYNNSPVSIYLRLAIGTPYDLTLLVVYFIILALAVSSSNNFKKYIFAHNYYRYIINFILLLAILLLVRIDFLYAWWLLLLGSLSLVVIRIIIIKTATRDKTVNKYHLFIPWLFFLIALNFLLNFYLVLGEAPMAKEMNKFQELTNHQSWPILKQSFFDHPWLGVGLDNFSYVFSQYRSVDLNQADNWKIRYNKTNNFFFNLIISGGGLAAILFLLIVSAVFYYIFYFLFHYKKIKNKFGSSIKFELVLILLPLLILLTVSLLFYFVTATVLFIWLVVLAVFLSMSDRFYSNQQSKWLASHTWKINFAQKKNIVLYVYFGIGLILLLTIIFLNYDIKYLLADIKINYQDNDNYALNKAVELSPNRFEYSLALAQKLAAQAKTELINKQVVLSGQHLTKAMYYLHQAESSAPASVIVAETVGAIYRDFSQGNDNYNQLAIDSFYRAIILEPSNPVLLTELGQVNLLKKDAQEAKKYFQKALQVKNDYQLARFGLAKAMVLAGDKMGAQEILEKLARNTQVAEVYYELGILYYNNNQNNQAKIAFGKAVNLSPLYTNALFGLALSTEKSGDNDLALYYLKKVNRLDPHNKKVEEKIQELSK